MAETEADTRWREMLTGDSRELQQIRNTFRRIPSPPRCKLCYVPFNGVGRLLRPWFGPWPKNPQICRNCLISLTKNGVGGAEVPLSLLFVDIRGSTGLGESMRPAEFTALLQAFYRIAADAIIQEDGVVDKFVGDEAIGLFIPGITGPFHAARAVAAGREILARCGRPDASSRGAIQVGGGVHTGIAFVGSVGSSEEISDFTALGDTVNTTARLASLAAGGELLVSRAAAEGAALDVRGLPASTVDVRGREATLEVVSIRDEALARAS
jgi:adenylate cyclase